MLRRFTSFVLGVLACGLAVLVWRGPAVGAQEPPAAPAFISPFPEGQQWRITCGYTLPEESATAPKEGRPPARDGYPIPAERFAVREDVLLPRGDGLGSGSESDDACGHSGNQWNRYALDFQHVDGPAAADGQPIQAAAPGTVSRAGWDDGLGWHVLLDHGASYTTVYAHMRTRPVVREGEEVPAGRVLGPVGCTGRCTGPHIHFALWRDGVSIRPEPICGLRDLRYWQVVVGCGRATSVPAEPLAPGVADFDGDGLHDLALFYEPRRGAAHIDVLTSGDARFVMTGNEGWWHTDEAGAFQDVVEAVAGDFTGDGRTDLAAVIVEPTCAGRVEVLLAGEDGFADPAGWWSAPDLCARRSLQVASADFDGDGLADIALLSGTDGEEARVEVLHSDGGRFVAGAESRLPNSDGWQGPATDLLTGDFDGDGRTDLAALSTAGSCHRLIRLLVSAGETFRLTGTDLWWRGSQRCASESTYSASGDFDGDGRSDDLAFLYEETPNRYRVRVLRFADGRFVKGRASLWWDERAADSLTDVRALLPGDFNHDGRTDLAILDGRGDCSAGVRVLASQGSTFQASDSWSSDDYCADGVRHAVP